MANDAMMITVDKIRFTYPTKKKMRVYAVGVAADNRGKVLVTEPPGSTAIRHNPKAGRPAVWDFGGDGYPIYHRTGKLAEIMYHCLKFNEPYQYLLTNRSKNKIEC